MGAGEWSPAPSFQLPAFSFQLPALSFQLPALSFQLPAFGFRLLEVRRWYVGLDTVERHIDRVRRCVARGGHDIPVEKIRARYDRSRLSLIRLLPRLTELRVYDNSREADPADGLAPQPILLLHMMGGRTVRTGDVAATPEWAKPILMAAMKPAGSRRLTP